MVKRGLVTFLHSGRWTKEVAEGVQFTVGNGCSVAAARGRATRSALLGARRANAFLFLERSETCGAHLLQEHEEVDAVGQRGDLMARWHDEMMMRR